MQRFCALARLLGAALVGMLCAINAAKAQAPGPVQPWGLPLLPPGIGPVEKFADVSGTPQGAFLEGGSFDTQGNFWFVAIGSGWISYLTPDGKLVPVVNCNPPPELGQTCEPQGTRWFEGKLYLTSRHRGILVYDPQTKELKTLVYTYRNQLFKGPNDLDFDADGNLFFTDPWGTGPGPNLTDQTGAVYLYSRDGLLRKIMDSGLFPNGIAVSPDNNLLAVGDFRGGRVWYSTFQNGPTLGCPQCPKDPSHSTFSSVKAGTYIPGNGGPDGIHYDGAVIAYHNQVAARPGSDRHQRAAGTAWLSSTKSPSRAQGKLENQRGVARACGGYSLPPVYMSHRTVTIFFNSKLIVHFGVTFLLLLL